MTDSGWHNLGGTIRASPAIDTLARLRPLLPYFGITRVARITGLDNVGIPVSVAVRPASRLLSTSQGKGITAELADISAIMESVECWHAERLGPAHIHGTAASLGERVPPRWRDSPCTAWMEVEGLGTSSRHLIPRACFDLDTTDASRDWDRVAYQTSTTGLASGNTWEEAVLHGVCEVVERDAEVRFDRRTATERAGRRLAVESVDDPHNRGLLDRLSSAGVEVELYELDSPWGLPVFRALTLSPYAHYRVFIDEGTGCHLSRSVALSRALTEAVQSRLTYIHGARDDLFPPQYLVDLPALQLSAPDAARSGSLDYHDTPTRPLAEDFALNLAEALRGGPPMMVLDHTRTELSIPVVHVVAPTLHDSAGR